MRAYKTCGTSDVSHFAVTASGLHGARPCPVLASGVADVSSYPPPLGRPQSSETYKQIFV
jgi:hypothetical protein